MSLGAKPEAEYLYRFGIDLIWGEGWWAEIEKAQDDENCPVMVWLKNAVGELLEGRAAPQPDPSEDKTGWWYHKLTDTDRPVDEIICLVSKQSTAGEIIQVVVCQNQAIVPPKSWASMVWHIHRELYHWGKDSSYQKLSSLCYFWLFM